MSKISQEKVNYAGPVLIKHSSEDKMSAAAMQAQGKADRIIALGELEAQKIIEDAKAKAREILNTAKTELETVQGEIETIQEQARVQGKDEGFQQGYEEGRAEIYRELESKINSVDFFASSGFEVKQKILKSAQKDAVGICIAICRKVCHKLLDEDTVIKIVEQAFTQIEDKEEVSIIVNPYLASMLGEKFSEKFKSVRVHENPKIAQDAIIVEALADRVDASVSSQIEEIANAFAKELGKSKVDE